MTLFRRSRLIIVCCLLSIPSLVKAGPANSRDRKSAPSPKKLWVDSVYHSLSLTERIGQLFNVKAFSGGKNYNEELITKLIDSQHIGGITFMQGSPVRQAILTNKYQRRSKVPMLVAMDAEWGLGMRLDSVRSFPRQMMLGATRDTGLVYKMGAAIAAQCRRLGVHIDFAPDVDVNNNAVNPVINSRSFGENKYWVAALGKAFMRGLQNFGVIACAKHFPGHGDTNVDSHKDLPLIPKSIEQLDSLELYPFRELIAAGVKSVMVAHLEVPALDTTTHVPTSLSKNAVTTLLKDKLGFNGLVITDALVMEGITKYFGSGEADLRAFTAGNDILLFSQDVAIGITRIKNAIDSGVIPQIALEKSVRKILAAKYDVGLNNFKDIDTNNVVKDLNAEVDDIFLRAAKESVTLVKDDNQVLNKINVNMSITYLGINANTTTQLYESLKQQYPMIKASWLPKGGSSDACTNILAKAALYDAVILGIHSVNFTPAGNYGLSDEAINLVNEAAKKPNVMIVLMGNAYASQFFCGAPSVLVTYEDDSVAEVAASEVLLKKLKARGKLPVTSCIDGKSIIPPPPAPKEAVKEQHHELTHTLFPVDAGVIDPTALDKLSLFIQRCIFDGVFPGCRILAARDGKVFMDKAYGSLVYDNRNAKVDTNTLYDLASCTKMLATNVAVMRLYEQGKLDLNKTLGDYLPFTKGTDKAALIIKDLLCHQAGLKAWIPFYKETLTEKGKLKKSLYSKEKKGQCTIPVAENLYLNSFYCDTIWTRILNSTLDNKGKSIYSDLDFIFLGAVAEHISGQRLDKYVDEQFYKPLGLNHILFNPLCRFDTLKIAPTEMDFNFRNELVHGYVHDPCAAMFGGVAGHAGLFGTAGDVAVMFQMLLNKGVYGKTRFFKPETVEKFTAYASKLNHRGLGFDKPATDPDDGGPAGNRCSGQAFGHQGFTGTCVWADPATGIVFVFLSNRVFPSAENIKINKLNVRTLAQDYIYESLGIPVNHTREELYKLQTSGK